MTVCTGAASTMLLLFVGAFAALVLLGAVEIVASFRDEKVQRPKKGWM